MLSRQECKLEEKLNELGYWKYTDFIYVKFMRNL